MSLTITPSSSFLTIGGQGIDLSSMAAECTVSEAAGFLNMTEHHLSNLLAAGHIVSRLENGNRLIQWDSLLDFEQKRTLRREALAEMVRENQEMGLYDD